jgi:hypothetical protein
LSALIPLLKRFGFSDIAAKWEPFQNTTLHPSSQSTEVVGPVETAYLNQIATFRLARREVAANNEDANSCKVKARTPWTLFPSVPSSPRTDQAAAAGLSDHQPSQFVHDQYQDANLEQFVATEAAAAPSAAHVLMTGQDPAAAGGVVGTVPGAAAAAQLDQQQYLRMAEEIGQYMTWDVALPSQFDFPMEEYFETPPDFEV